MSLFKAAFSGRSETGAGGGGGGSVSGRSSSHRKKERGGDAASVITSASTKSDAHKRKSRRSTYDEDDEGRRSTPRALTEGAVRMLDRDDEWEDEDVDDRRERKSLRSEGERRRRKHRSDRSRSRSRSRSRDRERTSKDDKTRRVGRRETERSGETGDRAIPDMGSFEQFPGQYSSGMIGPSGAPEEYKMSGALSGSSSAQRVENQFPGQPMGPSRSDSYGAAADYYMDEGESVDHQPGVRVRTPNMLVNPDQHLVAASAEPHPVQDTGNGTASDYYSGKANSGLTAEPQSYLPPKTSGNSSSGGKRPSKQNQSLSFGTAAAATAAAAMSVGAAASSESQYVSFGSQQQNTTSRNSTRPASSSQSRPNRQSSNPQPPFSGVASTNGIAGKQPSSNSKTGLYATGAATAGLAAYDAYEHYQQSTSTQQNGEGRYPGARQPSYGPGQGSRPYVNGMAGTGMVNNQYQYQNQQNHFHEHRGPMTRLKDGLFNLISSEEDTRRMEEYTEYIGVCRYCFDPRSTPNDGPRQHHYHASHMDSFEDLRRRRSAERMRRRSKEGLSRTGSQRIDKDSRYHSYGKSNSKTDLIGAGLGAGIAAAGVTAAGNAMLGGGKNFDDTYSVKSGHRESSAVRRRSRSSSREKRRRATYGSVGKNSKDESVYVRTSDGRTERRKLQRSRSRSRDRRTSAGVIGAAAGAALAGAAVAGSSRRGDQRNGASIRRRSRSNSRSQSPGLGEIFGFSNSKSKTRRDPPRASNGSEYGMSRRSNRRSDSEDSERGGGLFGLFSSPQRTQRRRRSKEPVRRDSQYRKKQKSGGFFAFGNGSVSSEEGLAFGDAFSSKTSLPLRRKNSVRSNRGRKKSDEHLAATVAGIGATAAALAAAQKGHRLSNGTGRPELGARRLPQQKVVAGDSTGARVSSDDEWEDELPSDVDDASSAASDLAFGDYGDRRPSKRQSMESVGSQSSGAGGLGAWGWRWGGKNNKKTKRTSSVQAPWDAQRPDSFSTSPANVGAGLAAGAITGAALDATSRHARRESAGRSSSPQQPLQYVDPRPISDGGSSPGSRHASSSGMPGAFYDEAPEPRVARPGPGPIQQPKPIAPIQPAFTDLPDRPRPRRTQSSPTRGNFAVDAALIGAAALGTAGVIASQRKSKEPANVRFGFTEEQERKHERELREDRRREEEEERRRADRTRALKEEAERHSREQAVLRAREDENRRLAERELQRQRDVRREEERREEMARQEERRNREREEMDRREQARLAEEGRRRDSERRQRDSRAAERAQEEINERERRRRENEQRERQIQAEYESRKSEVDEKERTERGKKTDERKSSRRKSDPSSVPWGVVGGAAAAATVGAVVAGMEHERSKDRKQQKQDSTPEAFVAQVVTPEDKHDGPPLMDEDIYDPSYFKKRDRSQSDLNRDAEREGKAADDMIADMDARYAEPAQSQAEFFAPEGILTQKPENKARNADATIAENEQMQVYHSPEDEIRSRFLSEYGNTGFNGKGEYAPYGVPNLNLITPTPPPSLRRGSRWGPPPASPLAQRTGEEDNEAQQRTNERPTGKHERSKSISWGEDKTHVYDAQTPDSQHDDRERDSYVRNGDFSATDSSGGAAATAGAHEVAVESSEAGSETKRYRQKDGIARDAQEGARDDNVEVIQDDMNEEATGLYRQPFIESVSDINLGGFTVASPGTEGAPPVRGFVEGEIEETPSTEEKGPHMPGGWNDEEVVTKPAKESTKRNVAPSMFADVVGEALSGKARDASTSEPPHETTPDLDLPLSKKDKKKREKELKKQGFANVAELMMAKGDPDSEGSKDDPSTQLSEEGPEVPLSKKEKKKREKAAKRGETSDDFDSSNAPVSTEAEPEAEPEPEPEPAWEPPLTGKAKKKREKDAKNKGLVDIATSVMTAGGIAAVTSESNESESKSPDSKKGKKSKKDKRKSSGSEREIADSEPSVKELSGIPGGWEAESRGDGIESPAEVVDPFQYMVDDQSPPKSPSAAQDAEDLDGFTESKKSKKKSKRDSLRYSEPATGSPLRSEIALNERAGKNSAEAEPSGREESTPATDGNRDRDGFETATGTEQKRNDEAITSSGYEVDAKSLTDSPRQISPDDERSVASDPIGLRDGRRKSKSNGYSQEGGDDEPLPYDDRQSVAASEPADYESSRRSKRRSRHADDDDTASVVSSRSRRDRSDTVSTKKEKKGGLFGLFSRKSTDAVPVSKDDGAPLSRASTNDSRDEQGEDEERGHRRRRSNKGSEYGDDDDSRSRASSSSHRHHRSRDERDEDNRSHRSSSRYKEDDYDRGESESRHRSRTDNANVEDPAPRADSESGRSHHRRRRTNEDAYDKDQSFLGMRVEDMPPLPVNAMSQTSARVVKDAQEIGKPVFAGLDIDSSNSNVGNQDASVSDQPDSSVNSPDDKTLENKQGPSQQLEDGMSMEHLPAHSESVPVSPTSPTEFETPHVTQQRAASKTTVAQRFPIRTYPPTPSARVERAASFSSPAASSPISPLSGTKSRHGRVGSVEFRPLYLVERNSKTPEVEDTLPSLPSSKPSSRASSMVGDDEYESAVEDQDIVDRRRNLTIDTSHPDIQFAQDDYLDSQQTTPKASEFQSTVPTKPARQSPQFYTWDDFARDERMHEALEEQEETDVASGRLNRTSDDETVNYRTIVWDPQTDNLPELPLSRPESPTEPNHATRLAAGITAAVALGGATALAHQSLNHDEERSVDHNSIESYETPRAEFIENSDLQPAAEVSSETTAMHESPVKADFEKRQPLSRKSSSKKKKGKKGKSEEWMEEGTGAATQSAAEQQIEAAEAMDIDSKDEIPVRNSIVDTPAPPGEMQQEQTHPNMQMDVEQPQVGVDTSATNEEFERSPPMDEDASSPIVFVSQLTPKQSKKAKKKQKFATFQQADSSMVADPDSVVSAQTSNDEDIMKSTPAGAADRNLEGPLEGLSGPATLPRDVADEVEAPGKDQSQDHIEHPAPPSMEVVEAAPTVHVDEEDAVGSFARVKGKQGKKEKKKQRRQQEEPMPEEFQPKGRQESYVSNDNPSAAEEQLRNVLSEDATASAVALGDSQNQTSSTVTNMITAAFAPEDVPLPATDDHELDVPEPDESTVVPKQAQQILTHDGDKAEQHSVDDSTLPRSAIDDENLEHLQSIQESQISDNMELDPDVPSNLRLKAESDGTPTLQDTEMIDASDAQSLSKDDRNYTAPEGSVPDTTTDPIDSAHLESGTGENIPAEAMETSVEASADDSASRDELTEASAWVSGSKKAGKKGKKAKRPTSLSQPVQVETQLQPEKSTLPDAEVQVPVETEKDAEETEEAWATTSSKRKKSKKAKRGSAYPTPNEFQSIVEEQPTLDSEPSTEPATAIDRSSALEFANPSVQDETNAVVTSSPGNKAFSQSAEDMSPVDISLQNPDLPVAPSADGSEVQGHVTFQDLEQPIATVERRTLSEDTAVVTEPISSEDGGRFDDISNSNDAIVEQERVDHPTSAPEKTIEQQSQSGLVEGTASANESSNFVTAEEALAEENEEIWRSSSQKKKDKKAKKGKKAAVVTPLQSEESAEPILTTEPLSEGHEAETSPIPEEAPSVFSETTNQEETEASSFVRTAKKKNKKGKKSKGAFSESIDSVISPAEKGTATNASLVAVSEGPSSDKEDPTISESQAVTEEAEHDGDSIAGAATTQGHAEEGAVKEIADLDTQNFTEIAEQRDTEELPPLPDSPVFESKSDQSLLPVEQMPDPVLDETSIGSHQAESSTNLAFEDPHATEKVNTDHRDYEPFLSEEPLNRGQVEISESHHNAPTEDRDISRDVTMVDNVTEIEHASSSYETPFKSLPEDRPTEATEQTQVDEDTQSANALSQQEADTSFFVKKGKKDKRKGKKSRSSTTDVWSEDQTNTPTSTQSLDGAPTSTGDSLLLDGAAAAVIGAAAKSADPEIASEEYQSVGSGKRSKKEKRKAKKGEIFTPADVTDTEPPQTSDRLAFDHGTSAETETRAMSATGSVENPGTEGRELVEPIESLFQEQHPPSATSNMDFIMQTEATHPDNVALAKNEAMSEVERENERQHTFIDNDETDLLDDAANVRLPDTTDEDLEEEAFGSAIQSIETPLEEHVSDQRAEATGESRPQTRASPDRQHDIDFTATVAAGLEDSGFNPDLVVNDPVFQRRASPPGGVAEANPEEIPSIVNRKKKKGKKARAPLADQTMLSEQTTESESPASRDQPSDDFEETLAKSLAGTGFDATLLQNVVSSNDASSNEVTGDSDISFATSRRKKGKKSVKAQPLFKTQHSISESTTAGHEAQADLKPIADSSAETLNTPAVTTEPQLKSSTAEGPEPLPDNSSFEYAAATGSAGATNSDDPANHLAVAGEQDMDVDEMDKAYKAYKKNKRNKKKQKAAAMQSESVSEADQQSRTPEIVENPESQQYRTGTQSEDAVVPAAEEAILPAEADFGATVQPEDAAGDFPKTSNIGTELTEAADGIGAAGLGAAVGIMHSRHYGHPKGSPGLRSKRSLGLLSNEHDGGSSDMPSWSFDGIGDDGKLLPNSAKLVDEDSTLPRDSGYQEDDKSAYRQSSEVSDGEVGETQDSDREPSLDENRHQNKDLHGRTPSQDTAATADTPLQSTTKNRTSYLFQSPTDRARYQETSEDAGHPTPSPNSEASDYPRSEAREMPQEPEQVDPEQIVPEQIVPEQIVPEHAPISPRMAGASSPRNGLGTILEEHHAHKRTSTEAEATTPEPVKALRRSETPQAIRTRERALSRTSSPPYASPPPDIWMATDEEQDTMSIDRFLSDRPSDRTGVDARSPSVASNRSNAHNASHFKSREELRSYSRSSNRTSTPTLRRTSLSGDLRAASLRGDAGSAVGSRSSPKTIPFEPPPTPPLNEDDDFADAGGSRSADMADVYSGYGDAAGSQVSPTRPPSMRKRQSMHVMELESRVDQLMAENQALHDARQQTSNYRLGSSNDTMQQTLDARDLQLREKDNEIRQIRTMLQPMQEEIARLTEINGGLTEANRNLVDDTNGRYATLQQEHAHAHEQWQNTSRELESVREEHGKLTTSTRAVVETEIAAALAEKNSEIRQLREELDIATEKIRALQVQIQSSKKSDFLTVRDEDYFDGACQKLCQHVQQWVLRFSKLSDNRVCRLSTDLKDEKIEARLDNAILDGSDVDKLLADRVRRRDVFMSVLMAMVWEYVFTRYLFGMDREQRQKLKALEKILAEVGPPRAVAQWRATTLTLLSKRPTFGEQRDLDTEAVATEVFALLCSLLPPPPNAEQQLLVSLQKVVGIAVELSIEMRTQRAEYIMLPPLQPEYDTHGDLVRKVHFNASLMNERSGTFSSNEELEKTHGIVKIVLFPLVVKKGDEVGEGEEEIVVCPAQVLVHNDSGRGKKIVRVQSGAMEIDDPRRSRQSLASTAPGSTAF